MNMRALASSLLLLVAACAGEPTQLIVVVETNLDIPTELDEIVVVVTGPSAVSSSTSEMLVGPDDPPFPLTLTVLPDGEALGPVNIAARGLSVGVETIRAEARTTLIEGETRMVRLFLLRGCIDRPCDGMTCGENGCTPIDIASEELADWTGEPPAFDGSGPCLANPWDQDGDGQGDAACGGTDCDDLEPLAFVGNVEDCDGIDNDCSGAADEGCDCVPEGVVESCPTRCGSTGSHMCVDGMWTTCVADEICSGVDEDCDDITDEGFDYGPTAPRQITMTGRESDSPFVVFANGLFNIVWTDDTTDDGVHFISLDESGDPGARVPVHVTRDARDPRIAWSGSVFGLTWWDPDSVTCGTATCTERRVNFLTMDMAGAVRSSREQLNSNARDPVTPRIVWTGSEFGIAYHDDEIFLHLADEAGNVTGPRSEVVQNGGGLDMLHTGSAFAFLFSDNEELFYNQGTPAAWLMPSPLVHRGTDGDIRNPAFVETGGGYFAAWGTNDGRNVESAFLDGTGALSSMITEHRPPMMRNRNEIRPKVLATAGQIFLFFRAEDMDGDEDIYFTRLAPDGTVLQGLTRISLPADQWAPGIAWGTDRLGLAYIDESPGDPELFFTTIGCI